ncbi:DEAD/DEAH box helicase family protein [Caldisericum sp.]|uniref:DEAD/DEAH box helicase family protein n=1 Tax=Caldisericum sp. TaxID=2499687 RepID=UPI003D147628
MNPTDILNPSQRKPSKAYLVNKLREAVFSWREQGYPGVTPTTKRLLQFWFEEDHIVDEEPFEFWFAQREAIETLIYIKEVLKNKNFVDLAREFGSGPMYGYDPSIDIYPNYAFKMATGSGKTFVMAMAIAWAFFNNKFENSEEYPSKFLLIAPNIVVYERLKRDFEENKIFKKYPFVPTEWKDAWNLNIILREDPITTIPEKVLFLTNIQQLEDRQRSDEVNEILDLKDVQREKISETNRIREVLTSCSNVMILKDEAHHIYHVEKAWKKVLLKLNENLIKKFCKGIWAELDLSATPKTETGSLFPWIIVDFALAEAIEMNIVKRPMKGILKRAREITSDKAHERYRAWINAGVRRWREYKKNLEKVGKTPILFIMCENTDAADDVYTYLNSLSDLKNKVLIIHTNLSGEIQQKDLDKAREAAKNIDEGKEYDAIVSVMMLNEGWDVRNVTIVVGLRSYTSKRKVLPEQVIGRGLRKMFPDQPAGNYVNMLEVIGPKGLIQILDDLEQQEGIELATFDIEQKLNVTTIFVDEKKADKFNIIIPILSPRIERKELDLSRINFDKLEKGSFELQNKVLKTKYIAEDMLTKAVVVERQWTLPVPQDSNSVLAYYTHKILKEIRLPDTTNFPILYPFIKKYVSKRMFKQEVNLDDPRVLFVLSMPDSEEFLVNLFSKELKKVSIKQQEPKVLDKLELKETKPFVWSRQVYPADKSVLNYQPCGNNLEVEFCKFLDKTKDVKSFFKIPERKIGIYTEYLSSSDVVKQYYPDYIIELKNGEYYFVETKGLVDIDVPRKDERAKRWCKDLTKLTGKKWNFIRVNQQLFESHDFKSFEDLIKAHKKSKKS